MKWVLFVPDPMVAFLEHGNEPSDSVRSEDYLHRLVWKDLVP
jgi:hypothetical protein